MWYLGLGNKTGKGEGRGRDKKSEEGGETEKGAGDEETHES